MQRKKSIVALAAFASLAPARHCIGRAAQGRTHRDPVGTRFADRQDDPVGGQVQPGSARR